MAFMECLGVSHEDTMESYLWRETLGRDMASHDAVEPVGGTCHSNSCRKEITRLHTISWIRTGGSSVNQSRVLHHAVARSLRENNFQIIIKDKWPFQQRSIRQQGGQNPLSVDVKAEVGALLIMNPDTRARRYCLASP